MSSNQKIKYIVYEGELNDTCVMFPNWVSHHQMAHQIGANVLGAGFVSITVDEDHHVQLEAYGSSTSLGVCSRPEDTILLNSQFG